MARELDFSAPGFEAAFVRLLGEKREAAADVDAVVADILADVRKRGDAALLEHTRRFDRHDRMEVTRAEIDEASDSVPPATIEALKMAARRIEDFHRRQKPADLEYTDALGVKLGWRWTPIAAVGLYVPGGKAAYPSSLLMNAIPAKVAGVDRVAMAVPAPDGTLNPLVLAAARLAGVDEIWRMGGAQAIAAFAYGTGAIRAVDKVVGPGNAYVAAAKRQVFGTIGIDLIAGPSEILVVADGDNDPDWIAADLLSQAEHDEAAQSILITDDADFARRVVAAVAAQLKTLPRSNIAGKSWDRHGWVIRVPNLGAAIPVIDRIAPEHVELAIAEPAAYAARIRNAGAIFLGRYTPEAIGDYLGGPNHVLPTARSARFSSGLGVADFMKRTTILGCDADALRAIGPAAVTLAQAEGLGAHARSVALRLNLPDIP